MVERPGSIRIFGFIQVILLVLVIVSFLVYRRRRKDLELDVGANLKDVNVYVAIKKRLAARGPAPLGMGREPAADKAAGTTKTAQPVRPALESTFPVWDKNTPPHEILGVPANASDEVIEKAFKKLLKKYHPDRFASSGKGFQNRAHHVVLLIQEARDRMLKKR